MTRFLASVRDPAEADTVLVAGADIVDLKDLELRDEFGANRMAVAIGNRWSLCLFRYVGPGPKARLPTRMGPMVRLTNRAVIETLD